MAGRQKTAFELAVSALSRRERTVKEVRDWLAHREVDSEEADEAIERLVEMGQLNDKRYAELFEQDKRELYGWGPGRIRDALVKKGIASAIAEVAVGGESHGELAERAADLIRSRDLEDDSGRGKALAFLSRRGYELEVAYEAVRLAERRAA